MPSLFDEVPWWTTADTSNALSREREKKLPVRPSFFNALVPQVSAADAAINRPDPVERASMLPFATYPDGSTKLALPGMIAEDIPRAFTAPARAYRGEIPDDDMISEGLNFAGNMAIGGSAVPKPSNAAGMFGGRLAKTADHAKLKRAEAMEREGFSRNDIRQDTGWFKDAGGNWRFEISDKGATYTPGGGTLGGTLSHPDLYEAYPQLRSIPVGQNVSNPLANAQYLPKSQGALASVLERFRGPSARIDMAPGADRPSLLHETQHAVDDIEGALSGLNKANPYKDTRYDDAFFEKNARATQSRADLTEAERAARAPWMDYRDAKPKSAAQAQPKPPGADAVSADIPMLPERAELEEAYRGIGLDPNDKYNRAGIEAMKGKWNDRVAASGGTELRNSTVDMALGRNGYGEDPASVSKLPEWNRWGNAMEAYNQKAQQLGHNGGPDPSTWEKPFIYSLDTDIARQIHEAQRAANPAADPNRLAQIEKRGPYYEVSSPVGNVRAKDVPDGVQITSSRLDPDVPRGMGYGTPLYEILAQEAAAAGKPLASDGIVSKPAQNVYSALSRRGYDVYGPPANALRHPDSGSLIANEPIYNVSAPNVAPREMPPPLPDTLYGNGKSATAPGLIAAEAADKPEDPLIEILRRYGVHR